MNRIDEWIDGDINGFVSWEKFTASVAGNFVPGFPGFVTDDK